MAKILFNVKFRPQIESGEYKVETRDGRTVRILCWDFRAEDGDYPILACVDEGEWERDYAYRLNGRISEKLENNIDLFLVTPEPEPELSEFEKRLFKLRYIADRELYSDKEWQTLKNEASELLELARKQIEKEVRDTVYAKTNGEAALEDLVAWNDGYKYGKEMGKEEALKDLPRWKKVPEFHSRYLESDEFTFNGRYIEMRTTTYDIYEMPISDLSKLPKEDEQ